MRSILLRCFGCILLFLFVFGRSCFGQQADTYSSITTDGTYIYTSVTVEGSMSGSWPPDTTHTYSAYNVIGSVGGWQSVTHGLGYASLVNNQEVQADDGGDYTWNSE